MRYAMTGLVLALSLALTTGCRKSESRHKNPSTRPAAAALQPEVKPGGPSATANASPAKPEQVISSDQAGLTVVQLDIGMRVIVKETHTAPIVDVRCYVQTGGMYEGRWLGAGISHLCEHLTAEGAEHTNPGEAGKPKPQLSRTDRIGKIGGQSNASTRLDVTNYYIEAAAGKTMDCIDLVCEWMTKPSITREDFEREHGIVQRELEMGLDRPERAFYQAMMANMYPNHPAAVPVIGHSGPLAALTYEDVLAYHSQMYIPQNMVYVVVGDVDTKAVMERICKNFGSFRAALVPSHTLPQVQPVLGVRRVTVPDARIKEESECLAFQSIPLLNEDLYALDLLSTVVGEGQASRLEQTIHQQQKLVTSIGTGSSTPNWGTGYFEVYFRCPPGKADAAEKATLAQLQETVEKGVSEQEVARAKRQKVAQFVNSQQTLEDQAETLAMDLMGAGDVNFSRNYVQKIQAVTAAQVQAAAKKYFRFGNMVITRMVPAGATSASGPAQEQQAAQKAVTFTLPNGLRVVLRPLPSSTGKEGLVSMVLATKGGLMLEDEKTNGMGNLMASLSTKGAGKYSYQDIAAFYDQAGGSISGSCGNNSIYWNSTVLSDSFDKALDIFAAVVQHPTFGDRELDLVRGAMLAELDRMDANPAGKFQRFFRKEFFTKTPYAMIPMGTSEIVKGATAKQLQAYHEQHIKAGASVLAIYGNFDAAAARATVEKLFADLPKGEVTLTPAAARIIPANNELHTMALPGAQTATVMVAGAGMTIFNKEDQYPMNVLKTILGGWQLPSGWLHDELRGKQLVYYVFASNWMGISPGAFIAEAQCQGEKVDEVKGIILKNLDKAAAYTPSQEEINLAVNTILTAELLDDQSINGLAMAGALDELWGFGYDYRSKIEATYRGVKPEDVARVAKKYLGKGYVILIGTPEGK
jgi:zinc protease